MVLAFLSTLHTLVEACDLLFDDIHEFCLKEEDDGHCVAMDDKYNVKEVVGNAHEEEEEVALDIDDHIDDVVHADVMKDTHNVDCNVQLLYHDTLLNSHHAGKGADAGIVEEDTDVVGEDTAHDDTVHHDDEMYEEVGTAFAAVPDDASYPHYLLFHPCYYSSVLPTSQHLPSSF